VILATNSPNFELVLFIIIEDEIFVKHFYRYYYLLYVFLIICSNAFKNMLSYNIYKDSRGSIVSMKKKIVIISLVILSVITITLVLTNKYIIVKEKDNLLSPIISYSPEILAEAISVKIKYPEKITVKEYSVDGDTWEKYEDPIIVEAGQTVTLYARGFDKSGNKSKVISKVITNSNNVNKNKVKYDSSISIDNEQVSTIVNVGDNTLNSNSLEYIWSNQNITEPTGKWIKFKNGATITKANDTGKYYLWVRAKDNDGNIVVTTSDAFIIDNTAPTILLDNNGSNGNKKASTVVRVTDNGMSEVEDDSLEYIWDTQNKNEPTGKWTKFNNGATITKLNITGNYYLWVKAKDKAGNEVMIKSGLFIIDNTSPIIILGTNGTAALNGLNGVSIASTTIKVTDAGGSLIDMNSLQYIWDDYQWYTGGNVPPVGVWTAFENGSTITKTGSNGNYYLWIKAKDKAGNETIMKSLPYIISNLSSNVTYSPNGKGPSKTASTAVTVTNVDETSLKYIWGWMFLAPETSNWQTFTNGATISIPDEVKSTQSFYLWIKGKDIMGNDFVSKSNPFAMDNTEPDAPTIITSKSIDSWTNEDVTVTINYPNDATVKQYSISGSGWRNYTEPLIMSSSFSVRARCIDEAGNESQEVLKIMTKFDKIAPTVSYSVNGIAAAKSVLTTVNVSDTGGSGLRAFYLKYKWDTQNVTEPNTGWTDFTNGASLSKASETGNYYLWIKTEDNAGNKLATVSNGFELDNTAPIAPTLVPSTTELTSDDVTVTINYPSDAAVKQYSFNGTTWYDYETFLTISENKTIYARAYDLADNQGAQATLIISNIDKTGQATGIITITPDTTNFTNQYVIITIDYPANSTIKEYSEDGIDWYSYSEPLTIFENKTVYARAYDEVGGLIAENNLVITNIDTTPPVDPTININPNNDWINTDATITIDYPEDAHSKEYCVSISMSCSTDIWAGGNWTEYTGPFTISENQTVYARSGDLAGNYSQGTYIDVTNIDKAYDGMEPMMELNPWYMTSSDITVTLTENIYNEMNSDGIWYMLSDENGAINSWTKYEGAFQVMKNMSIQAYAMDKAGNMSSIMYQSINNIDREVPESPVLVPNTTEITDQDVSVWWYNNSYDVAFTEYSYDGISWTIFDTDLIIKENQTIYARSTDNAGNVSETSTLEITNIQR
jgi:hypothetical protein